MDKLRIAFLASNNGTSFRTISEAIDSGHLDAAAVLLVSNRGSAGALDYARERGIAALHVPTAGREAEADRDLHAALVNARAELVILSGYLKKLGPHTLAAFEGRILNVHPALLPAYGGRGMYGRHVHKAVLENRERETGATVHLVDGEYDHGRVIAAAKVRVEASHDVETLERDVMRAECALFVETVRKIANGELPLPL